jgi:phosphoribosylformylglycinamidine synthase
MLAVAEAARNVACAGGTPIGATNCLNYGNPERPEIMWQIVEGVEGIADACRALDIPITGGNVSLYNETDGQAIYPTPVLGVVGLIEDASRALSRTFKRDGDDVILLGEGLGELGGSEYLKVVHGLVKGQPPALDLSREAALIGLLVEAAAKGLLRSAHDCSDGGLAVALAECAFGSDGVGVDVDVPAAITLSAALFGESASRAVVSVEPAHRVAVLALAREKGVPARVIGRTGGARVRMRVGGQAAIVGSLAEAEQIWSVAIERHFAGRAA